MSAPYSFEPDTSYGNPVILTFPSGKTLYVYTDKHGDLRIDDEHGMVMDGFTSEEAAFRWAEEQYGAIPEIPVLEPITTEVRTLTAPEFADAVRRHEEVA